MRAPKIGTKRAVATAAASDQHQSPETTKRKWDDTFASFMEAPEGGKKKRIKKLVPEEKRAGARQFIDGGELAIWTGLGLRWRRGDGYG